MAENLYSQLVFALAAWASDEGIELDEYDAARILGFTNDFLWSHNMMLVGTSTSEER